MKHMRLSELEHYGYVDNTARSAKVPRGWTFISYDEDTFSNELESVEGRGSTCINLSNPDSLTSLRLIDSIQEGTVISGGSTK